MDSNFAKIRKCYFCAIEKSKLVENDISIGLISLAPHSKYFSSQKTWKPPPITPLYLKVENVDFATRIAKFGQKWQFCWFDCFEYTFKQFIVIQNMGIDTNHAMIRNGENANFCHPNGQNWPKLAFVLV